MNKQAKEAHMLEVSEQDLNDIVVSEDQLAQDIVITEDDVYIAENIEIIAPTDPDTYVEYVQAAIVAAPTFVKTSVNSMRRAWRRLADLQQEIINVVEQDANIGEFSNDHLCQLDEVENSINQQLTQIATELKPLEEQRKAFIDETIGNDEKIALTAKTNRLIKKAWKSTAITLISEPFIFALARSIIGAKISNGKSMREMYAMLEAKYKLDDREKLAIAELIRNMGYPIHGSLFDGHDMIEQYFA